MPQQLSLAVNLANLGVGLYNLYQLRQTRRGIERLGDAVSDIDFSIRQQARALALLSNRQVDIQKRLAKLHQAVEEGFEGIQETLLDQESRREKREFETRMRALLHHYRECVQTIDDGNEPTRSDLDRMIVASVDCSAWLDTRLAERAVGDPSRLPLLVAKHVCITLEREARSFMARGGRTGQRAREDLARKIAEDAFALCDQRSLYEVSHLFHDVLVEYSVLHRTVTSNVELRLGEGDELVTLWDKEVQGWNDGMEAFRECVNAVPTSEALKVDEVPLKTIADYQWYTSWTERSEDEFDVHSVDSVSVDDLLADVGVPREVFGPATEERLADLRPYALAKPKLRLAQNLAAEFALSSEPMLSRGLAALPTVAEYPLDEFWLTFDGLRIRVSGSQASLWKGSNKWADFGVVKRMAKGGVKLSKPRPCVTNVEVAREIRIPKPKEIESSGVSYGKVVIQVVFSSGPSRKSAILTLGSLEQDPTHVAG